jgi:hypothetical protein
MCSAYSIQGPFDQVACLFVLRLVSKRQRGFKVLEHLVAQLSGSFWIGRHSCRPLSRRDATDIRSRGIPGFAEVAHCRLERLRIALAVLPSLNVAEVPVPEIARPIA